MPRKGHVQKRDVLADPIYHSKIVTRLINTTMLDGKRGVAQKIVYGAFDIVKEKSDEKKVAGPDPGARYPGFMRTGGRRSGNVPAGRQRPEGGRPAASLRGKRLSD